MYLRCSDMLHAYARTRAVPMGMRVTRGSFRERHQGASMPRQAIPDRSKNDGEDRKIQASRIWTRENF